VIYYYFHVYSAGLDLKEKLLWALVWCCSHLTPPQSFDVLCGLKDFKSALEASSQHLAWALKALKAQLHWTEFFDRLGLNCPRGASPVCKAFLVHAVVSSWNNGANGRCLLLQTWGKPDSSWVKEKKCCSYPLLSISNHLAIPLSLLVRHLSTPAEPSLATWSDPHQFGWAFERVQVFDWSVSKHFLPGVRCLTTCCSGNLPLFSSTCRIIESLRLEKTSKMIKSNCKANSTMPAKPCPEVPHLHVFWTPPGTGTPPLPWAACIMPDHSFSKEIFPNIQPTYVKSGNLPSRNWVFCCPFAFLGKDVVLESAQQFLLDSQSIFGNDLISLPESSSLYVPSETMASYLSSVGVQGDGPLNLTSSTDNNQWFSFHGTPSPSHPSKHPQVWM